MAKRKSPENRREWTLEELERIRYLRNVLKWTFPQIGRELGESADKCRCMYHTGRHADKKRNPMIKAYCEELGVSRYRFNRMRELLKKLGKPHTLADVAAALRLAEKS